jgi:hypothetical protein
MSSDPGANLLAFLREFVAVPKQDIAIGNARFSPAPGAGTFAARQRDRALKDRARHQLVEPRLSQVPTFGI